MTRPTRPSLLLLTFLIAGCATLMGHNPQSQFVDNVDWPLTDIRSVASVLLPIGQASMSSNGRVLRSRYFYAGAKDYKEATNAIDRYVAQFTLLGTGRPYDVEVTVFHERRTLVGNTLTYVQVGVDRRLTAELRDKLETELTKRREERNVIDDFRVY